MVTNTPGYSSVAVSEMALSLMLAVAHKIAQNDRNIRTGGWARAYSAQLYGKTLGVIGTGNIGRRMVRLGQAIGMKVIAWTLHPSPERAREYGVVFVTLEELMHQSDVISIHVPGLTQTDKLIGKRELALMKPGAILINTARGSVVDEPALVKALHNGMIAGAGLDVFTSEPLSLDHPLRSIETVVLSPHTAAMIPEATMAGLAMAVDNVANFLQGQPTNIIKTTT
jgi:D-3-phosphoglycerate dehydrogenase